jgi:predicted ABC-type ATPase
MPTIYIIAGPPGVGKSSNGLAFVSTDLPVLNHDHIKADYKRQQIPDYGPKSNVKAWEFIKEKAKSGVDFGIELNLGFVHHYDLLTQIPHQNAPYSIHVLLFFTDELQLCIDRAHQRFKNGGHYVAEEIVREMYVQTLPLLKENISLFGHVQFFDVSSENLIPELVYSGYYPTANHEFIHPVLPKWVSHYFTKITV